MSDCIGLDSVRFGPRVSRVHGPRCRTIARTAMCPNDPQTGDGESSDGGVARRTVLKSAAAASTAGGTIGAATGSATAHPKDTRIVLEAVNDGVQFLIKVSGEIAKGKLATDFDAVHDDHVVVGEIPDPGDRTSFRFSGEITAFVTGADEVDVWLDGENVDPDEFGDDGLLPSFVHVQARGEEVEYEFEVSEDLDPGRLSDPAFTDDVDGDTATGKVIEGDVDTYYFSGAIEFLDADGPLEVTVSFDGGGER